MNKVDLRDICTAPPLEWLAIHPHTGETILISLYDNSWWGITQVPTADFIKSLASPEYKINDEKEQPCLQFPESGDIIPLIGCHLCASTGYEDSKGEKVFGGDLLQTNANGINLVTWSKHTLEWYVIKITDPNDPSPLSLVELAACDTITRIGHIHIPSEWPDEVKVLLEKGENDDS